MSAPDSPIVLSLIVELRHFQVLIMRDEAAGWFATISERGPAAGSTRALGAVETPAGAGVALHLRPRHMILDTFRQ